MDNENKYVNEEGRFLCKVKSQGNNWFGVTTNGNEYIRVPLIVTDAGSQNGREISWFGYLNEKNAKNTINTLDDCFGRNWDIKSLASGTATFAGQACSISVQIKVTDKGVTKFEARWLNPVEQTPKDVDADVIETLIERVSKIDRGDDVKVPTKPANKTADGDDIPF